MRKFVFRSGIEEKPENVFDWHSRPGAFERLTPPWEKFRLMERTTDFTTNARYVFETRRGPFPFRCVMEAGEFIPGESFVSALVEGPFKYFRHTHRFAAFARNYCMMEDTIEYEAPGGRLGALLDSPIDNTFQREFRFRHDRVRKDIIRHKQFASLTRQRIAVTGASGLVGTDLAAFLESGGHTVYRLVRHAADRDKNEIFWNPAKGEIDAASLEGMDAVVHLAGENLGAGRWTEARMAAIRSSRIEGTRLLAETLRRLKTPPRTFISMSAVGYYGDRGDEILTENSGPGKGFLADLARDWEAATAPAKEAGIRVTKVRSGVVISVRGGALARMLTPYRLGLGGRIGSGRQYMSWIALDDLIGVINFALFTSDISGPVNAATRSPVTNAQMTHTIAQIVHRPAFLALPERAVEKMFGPMGREMLLSSTRAHPAVLLDAGFRFNNTTLEMAIRNELGLRQKYLEDF